MPRVYASDNRSPAISAFYHVFFLLDFRVGYIALVGVKNAEWVEGASKHILIPFVRRVFSKLTEEFVTTQWLFT